MVIRMFLLVVRVWTPFYWTERGFTLEHFEEGRFSIGSFLLFRPPSCTPLFLVTVSFHPHTTSSLPPPPLYVRLVSLKLQKLPVASVLK